MATRYNPGLNYNTEDREPYPCMHESPDGEYVPFEDYDNACEQCYAVEKRAAENARFIEKQAGELSELKDLLRQALSFVVNVDHATADSLAEAIESALNPRLL
jgi:hypothetical protein